MRAVTHFLRTLLVTVLCLGTLVSVSAVTAGSPAGAVGTGIPVMGPSRLTAGQLANWFRATGRTPQIPVSIDQLAQYYIDEGNAEGVRGDIAFAQSVVETGYFGFAGSMVKPANNNYAGMGACDSCNSGRQFPSAQIGVRAQIQHLRNFADPTSRAANLAHWPVVEWYGLRSNGTLDPALAVTNYDHFFAKGNAPTWNQMGGPSKWASATNYGDVVIAVYNKMLVWNGLSGTCPPDRLGFGGSEATECPLSIRAPGRSVAGTGAGYWALNGNGAVKAVGVPYFGAPSFGFDIARDIVAMPDGQGYIILDGYGGIHLYGSATTSPLKRLIGPYFNFDIARRILITPHATGFYILDGYGGIHTAGDATKPAGRYPYWPGWDIARSMSVSLDQRGLIVLDGFGSVWPVGAVSMLGTTFFGWDIARDVVVTPDGQGYAVLDGFGAIHRFGNAPPVKNLGYATFDRWRGIITRNGGYTGIRADGYVAY